MTIRGDSKTGNVPKASGAQRDRPELKAAIKYARSGDTLIVWKLDRLARSMKQRVETVETLDGQNIGFRSITEAVDTTTAGGKLGPVDITGGE